MSAPLTVAEVLERAADLIEPEGAWTQGVWARDASGAGDPDVGQEVCFCAFGAIYKSCGYRFGEVGLAALTAVGDEVDGFRIQEWNDAPNRTQAEVVAKLREAAAISRALPGG